jgi:hypothetical protein
MFFDEIPDFINSGAITSGEELLKQRLTDEISNFSSFVNGKSVLDIGCADGRWSAWALKNGASFVNGVDKEPSFINIANTIFPKYFSSEKFNFEVQPWKTYTPNKQYDVSFLFGVVDYDDQELLIDKCFSFSNKICVITGVQNSNPDFISHYNTNAHLIPGQDFVNKMYSRDKLFEMFTSRGMTITVLNDVANTEANTNRITFIAEK